MIFFGLYLDRKPNKNNTNRQVFSVQSKSFLVLSFLRLSRDTRLLIKGIGILTYYLYKPYYIHYNNFKNRVPRFMESLLGKRAFRTAKDKEDGFIIYQPVADS